MSDTPRTPTEAMDAAVRTVNRGGGWDSEGGRGFRVVWGNTYVEMDADLNRFSQAALAAMPPGSTVVTVDSLAAALHEANIDCDYSRKFDRKSCEAGDGPHSIAATAIIEAHRDD